MTTIAINPGLTCSGFFITDNRNVGVLKVPPGFSAGEGIREQLCIYNDLVIQDLAPNPDLVRMLVIDGRETWMVGAFVALFQEARVHIVPTKRWTGGVRRKHRHTHLIQEEAWVQTKVKGIDPKLAHCALDAVGLGLWADGALVRRK